ncbi:hypothetical protein F3Y22_tig00116974pilonHSYRG00077 [Hibiscus syriacus]|uniref:Serine aminopeptidase S33 domain-containing protein n=1 Tax=Hibiscus syriacus TaxID=106335 RepID=A0A6A2WIM7_HIBSY|nr:hypothetical protein F3Y22_tig00116974pilonHSYRG00077 [Hibiscus syriacus]
MADSHPAQNPVTEQRRVIITNKHGEKLVGLLHEAGSKEIVVLCHGAASNKDDSLLVNLAVAFEKEGISAFRFDFSANGESEGSFRFNDFYRQADDILSVVQHFSGENRFVSTILGHSKGGDVVLLYASKYRDIHIVVNVSGRYDLKRGLTEIFGEDYMEKFEDGYINLKRGGVEYRVPEEDLMDYLRIDIREACLKIDKECRVLTVHGSHDKINPLKDALEFAKIIPNHQLHIIEGADHVYTSHLTELASVVIRFIKSALDNKSDTGDGGNSPAT